MGPLEGRHRARPGQYPTRRRPGIAARLAPAQRFADQDRLQSVLPSGAGETVKRRIYFLAPDPATARSIVDALLLARIEERHIHVVAREGTPLEDLPQAGLAQRSDLVPALQKGVAAGGVTGLLAGLVATRFPPAGLALGGGALLGLTLFGAGFGAWMASMVGVGLPSGRLQRFESAIEAGKVLMMIDVPRSRVRATEALVLRHHPEAELEGTETNMPLLP